MLDIDACRETIKQLKAKKGEEFDSHDFIDAFRADYERAYLELTARFSQKDGTEKVLQQTNAAIARFLSEYSEELNIEKAERQISKNDHGNLTDNQKWRILSTLMLLIAFIWPCRSMAQDDIEFAELPAYGYYYYEVDSSYIHSKIERLDAVLQMLANKKGLKEAEIYSEPYSFLTKTIDKGGWANLWYEYRHIEFMAFKTEFRHKALKTIAKEQKAYYDGKIFETKGEEEQYTFEGIVKLPKVESLIEIDGRYVEPIFIGRGIFKSYGQGYSWRDTIPYNLKFMAAGHPNDTEIIGFYEKELTKGYEWATENSGYKTVEKSYPYNVQYRVYQNHSDCAVLGIEQSRDSYVKVITDLNGNLKSLVCAYDDLKKEAENVKRMTFLRELYANKYGILDNDPAVVPYVERLLNGDDPAAELIGMAFAAALVGNVATDLAGHSRQKQEMVSDMRLKSIERMKEIEASIDRNLLEKARNYIAQLEKDHSEEEFKFKKYKRINATSYYASTGTHIIKIEYIQSAPFKVKKEVTIIK